MTPDDAMDFIAARCQGPKLVVSDLRNLNSRTTSRTATNTIRWPRARRASGKDPHQLVSGKFGLVWLHEVFMRYGGEGLGHWMLDNTIMLSEPIPVEEAYPEQFGDRPVVIGWLARGASRLPVISGRILAASPDRKSTTSRTCASTTWKQVGRRAAGEVRSRQEGRSDADSSGAAPTPDRRREPGLISRRSRFQTSREFGLRREYDACAGFRRSGGAFNPIGTQQANRGTSETLGGMTMVANNTGYKWASSTSMCSSRHSSARSSTRSAKLRNFESDEALMLVGERARLFERYGVDAITDKMLEAECVLTIKAGSAASAHPLQRIR